MGCTCDKITTSILSDSSAQEWRSNPRSSADVLSKNYGDKSQVLLMVRTLRRHNYWQKVLAAGVG